MDARFRHHNTHLDEPEAFALRDPHLRELRRLPLVHRFGLLDRLPGAKPGIYTVGGGRQVGKTTLLKQWMNELLSSGVEPRRIVFLTGELIDDHHSLVGTITRILEDMPGGKERYLIVDEVTYIREWDRGVKYLADAGLFEEVVLVLTGSDLAFMQAARMRFPGRRGTSADVDFHLHPLTFYETLALKGTFSDEEMASLGARENRGNAGLMERLFSQFEAYLVHGGFLTAINDLAVHARVQNATFSIYSDWIRGDALKRGKQEHYLREVLSAITRRICKQVTWNGLTRNLSIDHPQTVADYVALLESMGAVIIQAALVEDKLTGAPKKARRLMFTDPFIFHAVRGWLEPERDPYEDLAAPLLQDPERVGSLAESCAVAHFRRHFPTYYIKAEGEVDIAYIDGRRFWPIEVKWSGQLRPKDLKQISKYPNARILSRSHHPRRVHGIPAEPLPLALLRLDAPTPQTYGRET